MDADFVGEVPDYLKCIVCHFVFNEPVMIIECGHRLCRKCFHDMCNHSTEKNTPLLCPIDRKEVEVDKVVDDKGIRRVVLDLKVKCDQSDRGCNWSGDLGALPQHKEKGCSASFLKKFIENVEENMTEKDAAIKRLQEIVSLNDAHVNERFLQNEKELESRYDKWKDSMERKLCQRDEELALLKYQVCQLRGESRNPSREIDASGRDSISLENTESIRMKDNNSASIDHDERDEELRRVKELLQQKDDKIYHLEYQLARVKNDFFQSQEQSKNPKYLLTNLSAQMDGTCSNSAYVIEKNNFTSISSSNNEKTSTASFPSKTADAVGKKRKMNCAGSSKDISESVSYQPVDLLLKHVMNVEEYIPGDRTVFKWRIHDFSRQKKKSDVIHSSRFYTSIPGHLCHLYIIWEDDGGVGVYIILCEGIYEEGIRSEFCKSVTFKSVDKYGKILEETIPKEEMVGQFRDENKPGMNQFKQGYGFSSMFSPAQLNRHVINDTLTIICVIDHD